jgi:hypothetical protein
LVLSLSGFYFLSRLEGFGDFIFKLEEEKASLFLLLPALYANGRVLASVSGLDCWLVVAFSISSAENQHKWASFALQLPPYPLQKAAKNRDLPTSDALPPPLSVDQNLRGHFQSRFHFS